MKKEFNEKRNNMAKLKLKGSVKSIFPETVFIIFAVSALVAVPIRVYQLGTIIDITTGFFSDKANLTIPLLYAVVAAAAVVMIVLSFLSYHIPECKAAKTPDKAVTFASAIMAIGLFADFIKTALLLVSGENISNIMTVSKGTIPLILQCVFAVFGCTYFIVHALSYSRRNIIYRKAGVLSLAVPAYFMCRLIRIFLRSISFINVSEVLFELGMLIFFILFFLTFSRTVTKVDEKGRLWGMLACGFAGALFGLICFIPRIAVKLMGGELVEGSPINIADITCTIFAVTYVVTLFGKKNNPKYVPEENEVVEERETEEAPVIPIPAIEPPEIDYEAREEIQKKERDELAFSIASQYADKK